MEKHKKVWSDSFARELDQLAQGTKDIKGTDTMFFIKKEATPKGCIVTYGRIVVNHHHQKEDPYRTRLTVGGDRIEHPWEKSCPTAGLTTSKLLFNSVLSTDDARFFCIDIWHFYLCTPLDRFEYMRLNMVIIPDRIKTQKETQY